jgi:hypothetical protein
VTPAGLPCIGKDTAVITVVPKNSLGLPPTQGAVVSLSNTGSGELLPVVDNGKLVGILTETDIVDSFIEAMGVSGPGYRVELALPNRPGMLFEVLKLMKDFDANIVSVATAPHDDPARKILVLRIETKNYKVLKSAIRKSGFELVSAD